MNQDFFLGVGVSPPPTSKQTRPQKEVERYARNPSQTFSNEIQTAPQIHANDIEACAAYLTLTEVLRHHLCGLPTSGV